VREDQIGTPIRGAYFHFKCSLATLRFGKHRGPLFRGVVPALKKKEKKKRKHIIYNTKQSEYMRTEINIELVTYFVENQCK
jgi:hypothetical protein